MFTVLVKVIWGTLNISVLMFGVLAFFSVQRNSYLMQGALFF